jgi:phosphoglycerate dehydrogenase-like enzyme
MPAGLLEEEYLKEAKEADFIVADAMAEVSAKLINQMPNLKLIHSEGVGYNFFDINAAKEREVYVCNCKGMNDSAVAEQALLLMLGVLRDVCNGNEAVCSGRQIEVKENYMKTGTLLELSDCKVGLIGFGDIAKALAKLLKSFHVDTFYYKKVPVDSNIEKEYNVTYLPLDELLKTCDIVSLHVPVTAETTNMVDDAFFDKMKEGSYLINTARGELVDSEALIRALKSNKLKMAGLDTVAGEPVSADNILVIQPADIRNRILFSPHIGGITASSFKRGYAMIWSNIQLICDGKRPKHVVNPW